MMPNTVRALTLTDEQFRERRVMNKQMKKILWLIF